MGLSFQPAQVKTRSYNPQVAPKSWVPFGCLAPLFAEKKGGKKEGKKRRKKRKEQKKETTEEKNKPRKTKSSWRRTPHGGPDFLGSEVCALIGPRGQLLVSGFLVKWMRHGLSYSSRLANIYWVLGCCTLTQPWFKLSPNTTKGFSHKVCVLGLCLSVSV